MCWAAWGGSGPPETPRLSFQGEGSPFMEGTGLLPPPLLVPWFSVHGDSGSMQEKPSWTHQPEHPRSGSLKNQQPSRGLMGTAQLREAEGVLRHEEGRRPHHLPSAGPAPGQLPGVCGPLASSSWTQGALPASCAWRVEHREAPGGPENTGSSPARPRPWSTGRHQEAQRIQDLPQRGQAVPPPPPAACLWAGTCPGCVSGSWNVLSWLLCPPPLPAPGLHPRSLSQSRWRDAATVSLSWVKPGFWSCL